MLPPLHTTHYTEADGSVTKLSVHPPGHVRQAKLPWYDFTILDSVEKCPRYGTVTYVAGKRFTAQTNAKAPQLGGACHDFYAAMRLLDLKRLKLPKHFAHHGVRIFGKDRFAHLCTFLGRTKEKQLRFCLEALYTSELNDDDEERDDKRTVINAEETLTTFLEMDLFKDYDLYVANRNDPTAPVGIEMQFTLLLCKNNRYFARFIGTIDAAYLRRITGRKYKVNYAVEHKTSAYNLNTAWEAQMEMTPQITGYLLGLEAITGQPATHCIAVGMKIPLPRIAENGINAYFTERFDHERSEWLRWVYTNARIVEQYRHDPVKAEARYHSCNAYFRPCALIEWCSNAEAEREDMLEDMLDVPWHPFRRAQVQK